MRPKNKNAQAAGTARASAEQNTQHYIVLLGTQDEARERHIRELGEAMIAAITAGNRALAKHHQDRMYAAIKARSPQEIQRRQTEIDRAIACSRQVCAIPSRRFA